ncbi:MAG: FlgD immunoglobulin-like domain containing protein, partial [Candidatus Zixiibacteriota bacterium]
TATNTAGSVQQSTTVFIAGTNNPPVIQSVSGNPFTINQGETVLFSVIATDADASDIITLRATSLPPNANFNTVTGTSSVTGNFSFTPDFTQTGSLAATFEADDGQGGIATMLVVINVIELENDRLFSTSALGQEPVGGLKGKGDVYLPINLITSQTVYGVQFDFFYNPSYFKVDSFVVTGRTADYVVYENIGQIPGEVRIVAFSLANEPIINIVDTTAIMYVVLSIDSLTAEGNYNFAFKNGWESVNPDPNYPSLALVTDSGIIQVDRLGDPNLDQHIDVADLVSIVAHIINNFTFNARQFDAADLIVNDTVNVFDLVGVINLIYGIPVTPAPPQYYDDLPATISLAYNDLPAGSNELMLVHSEIPTDIAAVELEINYDPASVTLGKPTLAEDASGLDIRYSDNDYGKLKVLLHFTNPFNSSQLIREGKANLINIPIIAEDAIISGDKEQLSITKALFATPSAAMVNVEGFNNSNNPLPVTFRLSQNYPNPFNPTTRIDFSIEKQEHVILNIYNILGQQVNSLIDENMPAGSYSIIWDATDDNGNKVATGIYLYKLQVDQKTKSKKMLFLK